MYSSSSQDYLYIHDVYLHQQTRRQTNYGHNQFVGSTLPNGAGHPQILHSNGSYGNMSMAPSMIQGTAGSLQRDFDQNMRDTAGSKTPFPSATHHSTQVVHQHLPTTVNPKDLQKVILPGSSRGKESSTSSVMRHHSSASKPYAKADPAAQSTGSRTARKDKVVNKDARDFPAQLATVMGPGPLEPAGYVVVPQGVFYCGPTTYPPIEFMPLGWKRLGDKAMKRLEAKHPVELSWDTVLPVSQLPEIVIKIQWPGYSHFTFEKRITMNEDKATRGELAELVCKAVVDFVKMLKDGNARVKREHAEWMIGARGLKIHSFFVPRLLHRGGNYFQPEIWVPSTREQ